MFKLVVLSVLVAAAVAEASVTNSFGLDWGGLEISNGLGWGLGWGGIAAPIISPVPVAPIHLLKKRAVPASPVVAPAVAVAGVSSGSDRPTRYLHTSVIAAGPLGLGFGARYGGAWHGAAWNGDAWNGNAWNGDAWNSGAWGHGYPVGRIW